MELNIQQIMEILPHRPPFLLVDKITECEPGVKATGVKCVTMNEPFFTGHFPGQPIMPGVLILEALAQTGAVAALSLPENKGKLAIFGGVKNCRFKQQVVPEQYGPVGYGKAVAKVGGKVAARCELTFVIQ